jgi:hypothetical protein
MVGAGRQGCASVCKHSLRRCGAPVKAPRPMPPATAGRLLRARRGLSSQRQGDPDDDQDREHVQERDERDGHLVTQGASRPTAARPPGAMPGVEMAERRPTSVAGLRKWRERKRATGAHAHGTLQRREPRARRRFRARGRSTRVGVKHAAERSGRSRAWVYRSETRDQDRKHGVRRRSRTAQLRQGPSARFAD